MDQTFADRADGASIKLQSLNDTLEAIEDALARAQRDNAPTIIINELLRAREAATRAYARAWEALFPPAAPKTPPQPVAPRTLEHVDRERLANRLRALFAPGASHFPPSPLSSP